MLSIFKHELLSEVTICLYHDVLVLGDILCFKRVKNVGRQASLLELVVGEALMTVKVEHLYLFLLLWKYLIL